MTQGELCSLGLVGGAGRAASVLDLQANADVDTMCVLNPRSEGWFGQHACAGHSPAHAGCTTTGICDMAPMCLFRCGFTNWTTTALGCDDFYTDPNAIAIYKNYVKTVLTRVNSVTGITYSDDPTIMGARMLLCSSLLHPV